MKQTERKPQNDKRKKYEKPRMYSEEIYERTVLGCNQKAGSPCELNPPTST